MRGKLNRSRSGPADWDGEAEAEAREVRQTAQAGLAGAEGWGVAGAPAGQVGFSARGDGVEKVEDAVVVGFGGCGGVVVVEERHSLDGGTGRVWFGLRGLGRRESWLRVVGVGSGRRW